MEIVKVREKTSTKITFASIKDMNAFLDLINNGQSVIFDYVDKTDTRNGEFVSPSILTEIGDGKIKIISTEKR